MEGPVRTCLACRARRRKRELLRLVADSGVVTADPTATRPGRGAYVCATDACVGAVAHSRAGALAKALRVAPTAVRVDEEVLRAAARGRQHDEKATTRSSTGGCASPVARGAWT